FSFGVSGGTGGAVEATSWTRPTSSPFRGSRRTRIAGLAASAPSTDQKRTVKLQLSPGDMARYLHVPPTPVASNGDGAAFLLVKKSDQLMWSWWLVAGT